MEQHPIPQQITSYEFKLVGEMTLKQFAKAAGGFIIALVLNMMPLVFFIKYPLMFIFAAGGLAMAFLPFQDRPLETWLVSFIKCIYSPTIYIWKKKIDPNWLDIDMSKKAEAVTTDKNETPTVLPLKDKDKVKEFISSLPSVQREEDEEETTNSKPQTTEQKQELINKVNIEEKVTEVKQEVKKEETVIPTPEVQTQAVNLNLKTEKLEATGTAVFGSIPMPSTPDEPNILAGMVTDPQGKIIEAAIIEIQDNFGNPVRVLKTNALGQFKASTQLANGEYLVIPEKDKYQFDRVKVNMNGTIVQPIKIQALG